MMPYDVTCDAVEIQTSAAQTGAIPPPTMTLLPTGSAPRSQS